MSGPSRPPPVTRVVETGLYVDDLARASAFYEGVLGLAPMLADARFRAYPLGDTVLLLFLRGTALETIHLPGGTIPPHDGSGPLHFALAVAEADIPAWRAHLAAHGIAIEGETQWPKGATSLYFRDPDGHLVELVSPGLWANY
ncbi:lactoylglutathione lyase [Azorhizobium oxalatiphilum]|uniref:Lactoylglutathione lyase n=1 Tax=Azorhizobium oxalatiphilum TaxID=980631 RepID=A0A917C1N8_9HYPH|nr:VOC family protein [Azorhizobium oxalatiphilum]GGF65718.1 lactoylglutathione lyase [Azorhizobium oxalatiphilum]